MSEWWLKPWAGRTNVDSTNAKGVEEKACFLLPIGFLITLIWSGSEALLLLYFRLLFRAVQHRDPVRQSGLALAQGSGMWTYIRAVAVPDGNLSFSRMMT